MKLFIKFYLPILLCQFSFFSFAQKDSCKFILVDTYSTSNGNYYLASNINGWNPKDELYKFKKDKDGTNFLICYFDKGTHIEFKFTRGNWDNVECKANGEDIENRVIKTDSSKFLICYILGWKNSVQNTKKHTASANVKILDTAYFIPQLNRYRKIWLYLPKNYSTSTKKYPVIYIQDAQNIFDKSTSAFGMEWGVDECLDSLIEKGKAPCIVVGIENAESKRMNEYNPYPFTYKDSTSFKIYNPEGNEYVNFLANTLKPFIDGHYRTLSSKENTIIVGSSMGGLISYYATLKYFTVFGKAGIFSPAFWTAPSIKLLTDSVSKNINCKYFFYIGEQEGKQYVSDVNEITEKLGTNSNAMIYSVIDETGKHNEIFWHKWFAEFYNWIMADGFNNVIQLDE